MSTAPRYRPHYTVDDFKHWEGDWELWFGTAVSMAPSPFGKHGSTLARIVTALTNAIDSTESDATVIAGADCRSTLR